MYLFHRICALMLCLSLQKRRTALFLAIEANNFVMAKALVDSGARILGLPVRQSYKFVHRTEITLFKLSCILTTGSWLQCDSFHPFHTKILTETKSQLLDFFVLKSQLFVREKPRQSFFAGKKLAFQKNKNRKASFFAINFSYGTRVISCRVPASRSGKRSVANRLGV